VAASTNVILHERNCTVLSHFLPLNFIISRLVSLVSVYIACFKTLKYDDKF